jgi:hypothetical protein
MQHAGSSAISQGLLRNEVRGQKIIKLRDQHAASL